MFNFKGKQEYKQKLESDAQLLRALIQTKGWAVFKKIIEEKIELKTPTPTKIKDNAVEIASELVYVTALKDALLVPDTVEAQLKNL